MDVVSVNIWFSIDFLEGVYDGVVLYASKLYNLILWRLREGV